ncbi:MAG TPA: hypothetical protein VJH23_03660 [archaeon]|nr:hypothetical protein [archaeon]
MVEIVAKTRSWGNSIGFRIPKEIVALEKIGPDEEIIVELRKKKTPNPKVFGSLKGWKLDAQKIKDEIRKESDW